MKRLFFLLLLLMVFIGQAQQTDYRATKDRVNNLVHTRLKVDFDFEKSQLNGEAWIDLQAHFYPTNTLVLDAKSFDIHRVLMNGRKLAYNYSDDQLTITLDKTYQQGETYQVYIKYTAKPEEVIHQGGVAITDAKGLYFIDPMDADPDKPTQVWTQGETESSSCWFPTIDSPNQKTSQEIYMRVPNQYVSLSNGELISQTEHGDGTRTDYWKMDEKHAPYLFFMGVGDFSVVRDQWNDLDVDYYVEKEFAYVAKEIFGHTPEMMDYFSELTGIAYPWDKYAQIVVRDYVSGAMENTTAVVHGERAQQHRGELLDENIWEGTIAHELFHHWFGDLVTCESWSNLTVNESFATYSVYLWYAYKYGKDRADAHMNADVEAYLRSNSEDKDLVRFYYKDKDDMFDAVSYNKGSAILHMLRDYLGDKAFFKGLEHYLRKHQFGSAEAHDLRLALEEISGKDLNWFFNQWFFGNGHIHMQVSYDYNTINKTVTVTVRQLGKPFVFPLSIDIYEPGGTARHEVWVKEEEASFTFPFSQLPKLVNVGAKHVLLASIKDTKTLQNYLYQYKHAPHYVDRKQAIEAIAKEQQTEKQAYKTMLKALDDPYYELRKFTLENLDLFQKYNKKEAIAKIVQLARNDKHTKVRATAIEVLGKLIDPTFIPVFMEGLRQESNAILSASLVALYGVDQAAALTKLASLSPEVKERLADAVSLIYLGEKDLEQLPFIAKQVVKGMFFSQAPRTQQAYGEAFQWIASSDNREAIATLADDLVTMGLRYKQYKADKMAINLLNQVLDKQQASENKDKEGILQTVKEAIAKLME